MLPEHLMASSLNGFDRFIIFYRHCLNKAALVMGVLGCLDVPITRNMVLGPETSLPTLFSCNKFPEKEILSHKVMAIL